MIIQTKDEVEAEAKAVVVAGSTNTGSLLHIKVQKVKEKEKAKAKEKVIHPATALVMVQKAVQRVQARKVAASLQLHVIHVVREVILQINAGTVIKLNLWFSKFSKIKCIISKYLLHRLLAVLVLQQYIKSRQV